MLRLSLGLGMGLPIQLNWQKVLYQFLCKLELPTRSTVSPEVKRLRHLFFERLSISFSTSTVSDAINHKERRREEWMDQLSAVGGRRHWNWNWKPLLHLALGAQQKVEASLYESENDCLAMHEILTHSFIFVFVFSLSTQ